MVRCSVDHKRPSPRPVVPIPVSIMCKAVELAYCTPLDLPVATDQHCTVVGLRLEVLYTVPACKLMYR